MLTRPQRIRQLASLTLGHIYVDMCNGFLLPLLPLLVSRLHTSMATLGVVAGVMGLVANGVQPLAGMLMHRVRISVLLTVGLVLAFGFAFLGSVQTVPQLLLVVVISAVGVAIFHPGALLGAHAVSGSQEHIGVPAFLSGGALGVAIGAVVVTQWVSRLGFERLWWLMPGGILLGLATLYYGRIWDIDIHHSPSEAPVGNSVPLPFFFLLLLACPLTIGITLVLTYLPLHLSTILGVGEVRWIGVILGVLTFIGALSGYLWGALSRWISPLRLVAVGQCLLIPILILLLHARSIPVMLVCATLTGTVSGGAFFPIVATLARRAHGLTPGLRAGMIVGVAWSIGALGAMVGAAMLQHGLLVDQVIYLNLPLAPSAAVLALYLEWRYMKRNSSLDATPLVER